MRAERDGAKGMVSAQCIAYARGMPGRPRAPQKKKAKRTGPKAKPSKAKPKPSKAKPKPSKGRSRRAPSPSTPSIRALEASSQRPTERALTDDERDAMRKVADTAQRYIDAVGGPDAVVHRIAAFVDEVRAGTRPEPKSQDVRLGLGALWGEQVRAQVGWIWVHLTYPDGFASYAVVPDDRAFACFPLNRVPALMMREARVNTSVALFNCLLAGTLPARKSNAYLVIG
jgi:hypothetical protein